MRLSRLAAVSMLGAALLATTSVTSATATPTEAATPPEAAPASAAIEGDFSFIQGTGLLTALSPTLIRDLTMTATDTGAALPALILEQQRQQALDAVAIQLQSRYAADYAGSSNAAGDGYFGTVSFVGALPQEARQLLTTLPFRVRVEENAIWSQDALERSVRAVTAAWANNPEVDQYIAYTDQSSHSVMVDYKLDAGSQKDVLVSEAQEAVAEVLQLVDLGQVPVTLTENPSMDSRPQVLTGGTALGRAGTRDLECTAAFGVTKYGGTGLLSAEHCGDNMNYEGRNVLATAENMSRAYGDAQWQGSSEGARNQIISNRANNGALTVTAITSVAGTVSNARTVYVYGTTGGRKTSITRNIYSDVRYPDGSTYGAMVLNEPKATSAAYTQPGDSGGPFFVGAVAYGVHSGLTQLSNGQVVEAWTPAFRIQQQAGLRILTS